MSHPNLQQTCCICFPGLRFQSCVPTPHLIHFYAVMAYPSSEPGLSDGPEQRSVAPWESTAVRLGQVVVFYRVKKHGDRSALQYFGKLGKYGRSRVSVTGRPLMIGSQLQLRCRFHFILPHSIHPPSLMDVGQNPKTGPSGSPGSGIFFNRPSHSGHFSALRNTGHPSDSMKDLSCGCERKLADRSLAGALTALGLMPLAAPKTLTC